MTSYSEKHGYALVSQDVTDSYVPGTEYTYCPNERYLVIHSRQLMVRCGSRSNQRVGSTVTTYIGV